MISNLTREILLLTIKYTIYFSVYLLVSISSQSFILNLFLCDYFHRRLTLPRFPSSFFFFSIFFSSPLIHPPIRHMFPVRFKLLRAARRLLTFLNGRPGVLRKPCVTRPARDAGIGREGGERKRKEVLVSGAWIAFYCTVKRMLLFA